MPPLAFLATHLLSTLLLSTPAPLSLPPPPETDSHTPSTLFLEVGDKRNNRPITLLNSVGLVHLHSAQLGTPGLLHLSLSFGYAHANEFPKPFNDSSYIDTNLWTATFAAAWVFLPWLEAYANYEVASSATNYKPSSSEITTPAAGQMLGDTHFGLKFAHRLFPSFYAGIDLGLRVFTDNQPMRSLRFAFRPVALLSWNLQELSPKLPLTFHSNFGLHIGRNAKASLDELAQPAPNDSNGSNVWTTFAWNLNKRYFGFVGFALEIPLPYATPFVEYQLTLPFWLKEDINPAWKKANPQSLSLGTKLTMLPSFSLFLGAEFQLKSAHVPGLNPLPPWRFFCGISLATQPLPSSGS
ncbi:MAG: hypothetical protein FWB81_08000, partial [Cystobacterineae bacterium]|nr:hypothetical protein [Cystobacterineae bacterium]